MSVENEIAISRETDRYAATIHKHTQLPKDQLFGMLKTALKLLGNVLDNKHYVLCDFYAVAACTTKQMEDFGPEMQRVLTTYEKNCQNWSSATHDIAAELRKGKWLDEGQKITPELQEEWKRGQTPYNELPNEADRQLRVRDATRQMFKHGVKMFCDHAGNFEAQGFNPKENLKGMKTTAKEFHEIIAEMDHMIEDMSEERQKGQKRDTGHRAVAALKSWRNDVGNINALLNPPLAITPNSDTITLDITPSSDSIKIG